MLYILKEFVKYKRIKYYVDERLKSIEGEILKYNEDHEGEHLHKMRVDIKKLKAVLSFTSKLSGKLYYNNELKDLFKSAGAIREIQVMKALSAEYMLTAKINLDKLSVKQKRLEKEFLRKIIPFWDSIISFSTDVDIDENKKVSKKHLHKYFKKLIEKTKKLLVFDDRESMHMFRMSIKRLMYIYSVLSKKDQKDIKLNKLKIDKFQEKLGDWHDLYVLIEFLQNQPAFTYEENVIIDLQIAEKKRYDKLYLNALSLFKDQNK